MKLNKTNLNKLIKWTSSKFNEYTKNEIIDKVLRLKPFEEFECRCGSYGQGAWNGGVYYKFYRVEGELILQINDIVSVLEVNNGKNY